LDGGPAGIRQPSHEFILLPLAGLAQTPEDKAKYEKLLTSAQDHIKQFIEASVKEVKELEVD
jgi:hypothetical protein